MFLPLKCFRHQNTVAHLIAYVPYAFCNVSCLFTLFLSFTQSSVAYEIMFCSTIAKQFPYKSLYEHVLWKMMTFSLVAKHTLGNSIGHAQSQLRPPKMSSATRVVTFQTPLILCNVCNSYNATAHLKYCFELLVLTVLFSAGMHWCEYHQTVDVYRQFCQKSHIYQCIIFFNLFLIFYIF